MSYEYERLADPGSGLRLHLNENTAGCSPRVVEALREIGQAQVAAYPDYAGLAEDCAAHLGVGADHVLLTNGLDEGILAAAVAALSGKHDSTPRALILEPAFDMYAACTDAVGGRVVTVPPRPDFSFPLAEVLEQLGGSVRLVFLTHPNNPTGQPIAADAIRQIAEAAPSGCLIFLDEAYSDFAERTFVGALDGYPDVVIGRTFAKAYGIAALRIGVLIGNPRTLAPMRRIVPPYSINVFAVAGLRAALRDSAYVGWYKDQVSRSKDLLYDACERWGFEYWRSSGNFVLVRVGAAASTLVRRLAERRIFIRDRGHQPGCSGCVRITAGVVEHTAACIAAIDEVSCAGE